MIQRFASRAAVFAASVLIFSFCRQILFFPMVARADDSVFITLSFLVFAFEAIAYGLTGALPDYYVRETRGQDANRALLEGLLKFTVLAFPCALIFVAIGIPALVSAILAFYLWLFARNAILIKVLFNKLLFGENYIYILFRLLPYGGFVLFYLGFDAWVSDHAAVVFALLLCLFEGLYYLRLRRRVRAELEGGAAGEGLRLKPLLLLVLPFVGAYILSGVAQRGDVIAVKLLAEADYSTFAKLYIIVNFFCSPFVIMAANPLMSFINHQGLDLRAPELLRLVGMIVAAAVGVAVIAALLGDLIYWVFYRSDLGVAAGFVFALVFLTISYSVMRTLTLSFASVGMIAIVNGVSILLMGAGLLVLSSYTAILLFYLGRMVFYAVALQHARQGQS